MIFTFIPNPKDAQEAGFQSRMMDRALTLVADGYKINPFHTSDTSYYVHTPEGECYIVDTNFNECQCKCWKKHRYCKHLIACHLENERRLEEYQAEYLEEDARNRGLID